jgi:hypothetical protein
MNIDTVNFILGQCVQTFRKQADVTRWNTAGGFMGVIEINTDPHESECPANLTRVDVHFFIAGIDKDRALECRPALIQALMEDADLLKRGPSYITIGAHLGDQQAALMLMALGEVMGLWRVITPAFLALPEDQRDRAAGAGYVMTSGFRTGPFKEGIDNGNG